MRGMAVATIVASIATMDVAGITNANTTGRLERRAASPMECST